VVINGLREKGGKIESSGGEQDSVLGLAQSLTAVHSGQVLEADAQYLKMNSSEKETTAVGM
jgi:hypothetical protein